MDNVRRNDLMPGHAALIDLIEEFDIDMVTRDGDGNITIFYRDERIDALNVTPRWIPVAED